MVRHYIIISVILLQGSGLLSIIIALSCTEGIAPDYVKKDDKRSERSEQGWLLRKFYTQFVENNKELGKKGFTNHSSKHKASTCINSKKKKRELHAHM